MTDVKPLLLSAIPAFTATVSHVAEEAWDDPTPCEGWTVRHLVNHMTSEHLWAPRLLAGETIDDVGDAYDGDVLGDDPIQAWREAARASADAWAYADLSAKVHLSSGLTSVESYGEEMLLDLAVHRWDLQRGADVGEGMDGAVVQHVMAWLADHPETLVPAGFRPPVPTDSEYAHDQLLAMTGRDPFWSSQRGLTAPS
jgi:uncharacterized protein (TIGR03086 family)